MSDFKNGIFRITSAEIKHIDNGADGVLFLTSSTCSPYSYVEPANGSAEFDLVPESTSVVGRYATRDECRLLIRLWFYALFFLELFPTKPILAFIGPKGSGKTSLFRRGGQILFGPDFNVVTLTDDEKDFDAAVTKQ